MKRLLVIAGPNGSGKSSLVHDTKLSVDMDAIINPDNYARGLCDKIADPVERYKIAMNVCDSLRNRLLEEGVSFGFETVASKRDKLEFVKKAKDKGYYIDFIFVSAGTPERCYERVQERVRQGGLMYQRRRYLPDTEGRWASYGNILKFQIMLMYGIILGMGWFCC